MPTARLAAVRMARGDGKRPATGTAQRRETADNGNSQQRERLATGSWGWRRVPTQERIRAGAVPPLTDGFSARPETASALGATLVPGSAVVLVPGRVAAGRSKDWLGTCGKTQLAVSAAEWLWQSGKVDLLVWASATSRASVLSSYVEAAATAMRADPARDAEVVASGFISWLAETSRSWLVVLDDLCDTADLDGLRPEGAAGRVLITSRSSVTILRENRAFAVPVGAFSPREALSYLMGRLTADPDQRLGAIDLIQDLGCEPLALAHASGVIASSVLSCADYRGYFAQRRDHIAQATGSEPAAAAVTWTLSAEHADQLSPGAIQPLLVLAALLDGNGIPAAVFATPAACGFLAGDRAAGPTGPAGPELARGSLLALERVGLVATGSASTPTVRVNAAIQAAVRAATHGEMLDQAARAAADALLQAWPEDESRAWSAGALRSCAASLQRIAGNLLWAGGCHPLLLRAGESLDRTHLTGPAVAYWRELAAVSGQVLGPNHADTLAAGQRLAHAYLAAGRPADAVSWFEWALAERARTLGQDHPTTVAARLNRGRALVAANRLIDAVAVLDRAVRDYERVCGSDHPDTLGARDELAAARYAAGQIADAIRLYRRTLQDREHLQGAHHPGTITTRQKLADAYLADGRIKDALSQYKQVLADSERVFGPDHPDTITARASLGTAYHSAGRMASALQLYEQAAAGYETTLGADHPDTLACRANLAHAYCAVGRLTDGMALLRDTAARCERVLPPGDPLTQTVRESLESIGGG
jgi:tetratricopeptide (TPR) repeat protein